MVNMQSVHSMTAYATQAFSACEIPAVWEIKSVNSKTYDIRLRVPDWINGLEPEIRKIVSKALSRGAVSISLRLGVGEIGPNLAVDPAKLDRILSALALIRSQSAQIGLETRPPSPAEIYALPGVAADGASADPVAMRAACLEAFAPVLAAFVNARAREGAALEAVMRAQVAEIARLTQAARASLPERAEAQRRALEAALARLGDVTRVDPERVAQELAVLAIKSDVTEELDRLDAHVTAAHDLLDSGGMIGKRLDFLMQEFNREANTLCSKSQDAALTTLGLALKTEIDRLREQVQNIA